VNKPVYDTEYLKENIQKVLKGQALDSPVLNLSPGSDEASQQNTGNKTAHDYRRVELDGKTRRNRGET
jgi:hypothetical protein